MQNKEFIRNQKHIYGQRWGIFKHNRKNKNQQIVTLHDRLVLSKLKPGTTLFLDFIGHQYANIVPNINLCPSSTEKYSNLILDQIRFRYKTFDEIFNEIKNRTYLHAEKNATIIVGFNYQFVKFNRLKNNYRTSVQNLLDKLADNYIILDYELKSDVPKTNPYGDCFFVFNFKDLHD